MGEKSKGYVFIAIAGLLWATLGLFGKFLMGNGLTSEQVAFTRLFWIYSFRRIFIYKNTTNLKDK